MENRFQKFVQTSSFVSERRREREDRMRRAGKRNMNE
jgi:hypothetical protein